MLKMNGHAILNFMDAGKYFSPWAALEHLMEFQDFAAVHCVPLPSLIRDEEGTPYKAEYLNKELFLQLLGAGTKADASFEEYRRILLKESERWREEQLDEEETEEFETELKESGAERELLYIKEALKEEEEPLQAQVLSLWAMCKLVELPPEAVDFARKEEPVKEKKNEKEEKVGLFPTAPVVFLTPRTQPYRYWLCEEEPEGSFLIETVRIEAGRSKNEFEKVNIELYSEREGKRLWEFTLERGEYRHLNVVQGKIVKFLSTIDISRECCVMRPDYREGTLSVISPKGEKHYLEVEKDISGFACNKDGELLIRDGKVVPYFYEPYKRDYYIACSLEGYWERFVEISLKEDGDYLLLTEQGVIRSNNPHIDGKKQVLTLNGKEWMRELQGLASVREFAVDEKKTCLAIHGKKKEECNVYWEGQAEIEEKGSSLLTVRMEG